jgi:hypothetical protein
MKNGQNGTNFVEMLQSLNFAAQFCGEDNNLGSMGKSAILIILKFSASNTYDL